MDRDWWTTCTLVVLTAWLLWKYLSWNHGFWQRLDVPCPQPSVPFGNMKEAMLGRKHPAEVIDNIYRQMEGQPFCGFYRVREPILLVRDAELARTMLVRDFPSFHDNNIYVSDDLDPIFSRNPFFVRGERWRKLRSQLSPSFTASRLKPMFLLMKEVCDELVKVLKKEGSKGDLEAREICMWYTTDVVASCALGIKGGAVEDHTSELLVTFGKILEPTTANVIKFTLATGFPLLAALFRIRLLPLEVDRFLRSVVSQTVARRQYEGVHRNDYLQMLVELKTKGYLDSGGQVLTDTSFFTDVDIAGQVMTFMADGIHTSSAAMSAVLYELALNPDAQERLRRELQEAVGRHEGQLCYEVIQEASYLDMVLSEALRLHPPVGFLEKTCTAPYPMTSPSGRSFTLQPGMTVIVPVSGLHYDPRYFPKPEVFDPERFSSESKDRLAMQAYLPFGAGPRACIGQRFAMSQVKMGLAAVVLNFKIHRTPRTPVPIRHNQKAFLRVSRDGLWLGLSPLVR